MTASSESARGAQGAARRDPAKFDWTGAAGVAISPARLQAPALRNRPAALDEMKEFLLRFFTWWNGATLNTLFYTRLKGELVGHDEFGNAYYRTRGGKIDPALGFERRWVIYNGISEASMTPPGWNGWLHHTVDTPPTEETYTPYSWELPHIPNTTGTPAAIRPKGSILLPRPPPAGDRGRLRGLEPRPLSAFISPRFTGRSTRMRFLNTRSRPERARLPRVRPGGEALLRSDRLRARPRRRAGERGQDQQPDGGVQRPRQDHRANHHLRGGDQRDGPVRHPAGHAERLLLAPTDRAAPDGRLHPSRRDRREASS